MSPADKGDTSIATVNPQGTVTPVNSVVAPSGDGVGFSSNAATDASHSALPVQYYGATRTASGWGTEALMPPGLGQAPDQFDATQETQDVTADFGRLIFATQLPYDSSDQDTDGADLYVRDADGTVSCVSCGQLNQADEFNTVTYAGRSADGSDVLFYSSDALLQSDAARTSGWGLYDWRNGDLELVGVDSQGSLLSTDGVCLGGPDYCAENGSANPEDYNAISRDGSRVFFTTLTDGRLYARDVASGTTTAIPPGAPPGTSVAFAGATPDGSQVFFRTDAQLTPDDTDTSNDLYRYAFATGTLTRISAGPNGNGQNANANVMVRVSDDGQRVYFKADQLIPNEGSPANDLYLWDDGDTRLVAGNVGGLLFPQLPCGNWQVTPDGGHLLFASQLQLTADDTDGVSDLYVYDANAGRLVRASRPRAGEPHAAGADIGIATETCPGSGPAVGGLSGTSVYQVMRAISDDGRYVFFETSDALLPSDTNGVHDVYEYDTATDTTSLISAGIGEDGSFFLGSSASGKDVAFITFDRLVPADQDTAADVYDARVGGGFTTPATAPPCDGDACQGSPAAAPAPETVASITFSGPGNATPGPPTPRVRVLSRVVHGSTLVLRVKVPTGGRITATGKGIRRMSRVVRSAGIYRLRVRLTANARRALAHGRKLRLKLRVSYRPLTGNASAATVKLTIKPARERRTHATQTDRMTRDGGGAR